jgi:phosphoglycerate dehydrogenase-like enzyme
VSSRREKEVSGRPRVLVAGSSLSDRPPGIEAADGRVELAFADTPETIAGEIAAADVIFAWRPQRDLLEPNWAGAQRVRWVQSASAGVDALLFRELVEGDVVLTNARGVFDEGMAEWAIACMLIFAKDLATTVRQSAEGAWEHRTSEPLAGRSVLVVGAGTIGMAIGRKARALGMRTEAVARSARGGNEAFDRVTASEDLLAVLPDADYVVNALPLTGATRRTFDDRAFAVMRPTARFLNLGRGETVDEGALATALREGLIAGAALDVFEVEPLPDGSPLWGMPNVIVSPHNSGDLHGWERSVVEVFLDNLDRWLRGVPLRNVIDKRAGYVPTA